jgi:hypothetical protein
MVLPWLVSWVLRAGARDFCSALAALVGQIQNIFSSTYIFSNPLSPIAQQARANSRAGSLVSLIWVSGLSFPRHCTFKLVQAPLSNDLRCFLEIAKT